MTSLLKMIMLPQSHLPRKGRLGDLKILSGSIGGGKLEIQPWQENSPRTRNLKRRRTNL
jgi:hypothetical protein